MNKPVEEYLKNNNIDKRIEKLIREQNGDFKFYTRIACKVGTKGAVVYQAICDLQENNIEATTQNIHDYIGFLSSKIIQNNLIKLKKANLISNNMETEEIKNMVISGEYKNKKCEWCGDYSMVLNEHHYPIPRSEGGTETVSICPNCHYGFHYLENQVKVVAR